MAGLRAATTATYGTADRRENCILLATAIYVSANEAYEAKIVQEDGSDPRDWNVDIRPASGKNGLKVGQPELVYAQNSREITATLHDPQATDQPAATSSHDQTDGSILAPVRMSKDGKAALRRFWLAYLSTGENGLVEHIGTVKGDDGEETEEERAARKQAYHERGMDID